MPTDDRSESVRTEQPEQRQPGESVATAPALDPGDARFHLEPIPKLDVFRAVLKQLEAAAESIGPGGRLGSERELAERLHVSRVSIREALRALESMGKVEIRRNSGTYVTDGPRLPAVTPATHIDEDYIQHLSEVREAIECAVVRGVLANPDRDLSAVRDALDSSGREIGRADSQGSLDLRFESALAKLCGNPVLATFHRQAHEMWIDAWVQLGGRVGDATRFHREHEQILAAIEAGQTELAVALMANHVNPPHPTPRAAQG